MSYICIVERITTTDAAGSAIKTHKIMKKIDSTIDVQVLVRYKSIEVPVMRNGKATKRTKYETIPEYTTIQAQGYEIDGHVVYVPEIDLMNGGINEYLKGVARVYRENGEKLTGTCVYGHTGKVEHTRNVLLSIKDGQFCMGGNGYYGPCGKGHTIYMGKINW